MNSHLVAVEVGVKSGARKGMESDSFALDQNGTKCLNTQPVQRRSAVQENGVISCNLLKDIVNDRLFRLDHFLCVFDGMRIFLTLELANNKRVEKFKSHLFGNTALVKIKFGSNNDNRTTGIINAFS